LSALLQRYPEATCPAASSKRVARWPRAGVAATLDLAGWPTALDERAPDEGDGVVAAASFDKAGASPLLDGHAQFRRLADCLNQGQIVLSNGRVQERGWLNAGCPDAWAGRCTVCSVHWRRHPPSKLAACWSVVLATALWTVCRRSTAGARQLLIARHSYSAAAVQYAVGQPGRAVVPPGVVWSSYGALAGRLRSIAGSVSVLRRRGERRLQLNGY